MDSTGSSLTPMTRLMPVAAIALDDLRTLLGSWLVRIWLAATALVTLLATMSHWEATQTAPLIASLLFPYLVLPWFLVVMVLGVSPVSGARAESLADGILSRAVTRYEYLLAVWAARVLLVLGVYLVVMVPAVAIVALAERSVEADPVTVYGVAAALGVVGLVLVLVVSLGFLLGILLRKPLLALMLLVFTWFPIILVLDVFSLEEFSPISLNQAIPALLRQPWSPGEGDLVGEAAEPVTDSALHFLSVLTGVSAKPAEDKPAEDKPAEETSEFFTSDDFDDVSLKRVALGYGIPTLLAVGLAVLCFCRRDL